MKERPLTAKQQRCNKCNQLKDSGEFTKGNYDNGLRKICKVCDNGGRRKRYAENEEYRDKVKNTAIRYRFKKVYGITPDDYNKMFTVQNGQCKICERHQIELEHRLGVDHNHETNKVRALLCKKCNQAVGIVENNNIEDVITYIKCYE